MRRKSILVLGMHRSGTSALARMMSFVGCDLPSTLMPGADGNPSGHWESSLIMALNDTVLESGGSSWDDWLEFNPKWYESPVFDGFITRGITVLREEYSDSPLFVLKDPRNCRLAPFWFEVLSRENIEPLVVVPLRNPIEVAASLKARNNMHPDLAMLLWLRHVLDAEHFSRGHPRVFLSYAGLLEDWVARADEIQRRFGLAWPRFSFQASRDVNEFLNVDERHHVRNSKSLAANPMVSQWIRDASTIFDKWVDSGEDPVEFDMLDEIRRHLNNAGPAFANLTNAATSEQIHNSDLRAVLAQKQDELVQLNERLTLFQEQQEEIPRYTEVIDRLEAERTALEHRVVKAETAAEGNRVALEDVEARLHTALAEKTSDATVFAAERDRLKQIARDKIAEIDALNRVKDKLSGQLNDFQNDFDQNIADLARNRHDMTNVTSTLRQREEEISQTLSALEAEKERSSAAERELRDTTAQYAVAEANLKTANGWVFRLAGERHAANVQLTRAEMHIAVTENRLQSSSLHLADFKERYRHGVAENSRLLSRVERLIEECHTLGQSVELANQKALESERKRFALQSDLDLKEKEAVEHSAVLQAKTSSLEALLRQQTGRERELLSVIETIRIEVKNHVSHSDALQTQVASLDATLRQRDAELSHLEKFRDQSTRQIDEQSQIIANLSNGLKRAADDAIRNQSHLTWLSEVNDILTIYPGWWHIMPWRWRMKKIRQRLSNKNLFDTDAYLARYPDVMASKIEPIRHYILHGIKEERQIS